MVVDYLARIIEETTGDLAVGDKPTRTGSQKLHR